MAHPALAPIVEYFREYGQVGLTETFNGVTYWTDDQLTEIIHTHQKPMTPILSKLNDAHDLWNIEIPRWYWLNLDTVDVQDSSGNSLYSTWTTGSEIIVGFGSLDLSNNIIDSTGYTPSTSSYQVFGLWINMYDALADLWDKRASQRYDYIQMKAGQNTVRMQNEYEHCIKQRDYYRGKIARSHDRTGVHGRWVV